MFIHLFLEGEGPLYVYIECENQLKYFDNNITNLNLFLFWSQFKFM